MAKFQTASEKRKVDTGGSLLTDKLEKNANVLGMGGVAIMGLPLGQAISALREAKKEYGDVTVEEALRKRTPPPKRRPYKGPEQ